MASYVNSRPLSSRDAAAAAVRAASSAVCALRAAASAARRSTSSRLSCSVAASDGTDAAAGSTPQGTQRPATFVCSLLLPWLPIADAVVWLLLLVGRRLLPVGCCAARRGGAQLPEERPPALSCRLWGALAAPPGPALAEDPALTPRVGELARPLRLGRADGSGPPKPPLPAASGATCGTAPRSHASRPHGTGSHSCTQPWSSGSGASSRWGKSAFRASKHAQSDVEAAWCTAAAVTAAARTALRSTSQLCSQESQRVSSAATSGPSKSSESKSGAARPAVAAADMAPCRSTRGLSNYGFQSISITKISVYVLRYPEHAQSMQRSNRGRKPTYAAFLLTTCTVPPAPRVLCMV